MKIFLSVVALGLAAVGAGAQLPRAVNAGGDASPPGTPDAPAHVVQIDVRGAAALVTVTRSFPGASTAGTAREEVLDLALPAAARLIDVEVDAAGKFEAPSRAPDAQARDGYVEATRAMGLGARAVPYDDETTTRIRVASKQQRARRPMTIRYRFSTLLQIAGRRAEIVFPPSPETSPVAARVTVRADAGQDVTDISIAGAPHPLARGAAVAATEAVVATSRKWIVSLGLGREAPSGAAKPAGGSGGAVTVPPSRVTALAARAPLARAGTGSGPGARVACAVGLSPAPPQPLPERVLFLIDRSRSVGAGGLELERDAARRILTALPPSTEFNALFFDRTQARLFPVARTATRQALAALEDEMVPARLQNGTHLAGALSAAGEMLRRESASFAPRTLVVLLTDGAVGHPSRVGRNAADAAAARGRALPADATDLLGPHPGIDLMLAALSVRANDDPPVSPDERRELRHIAASARLGAVERALTASELDEGIPAALEALRTGGDVFAVRLGTRETGKPVAPAIGPGGGAAAVISLDGKANQLVNASMTVLRGAEVQGVPVRLVSVEPRWLPTAPTETAREDTRLLLSPAVAVLVEPVVRPAQAADPNVGPSGYLERSVVRDALSLAFTPRARACYLNRTGATPAEQKLTGRVRLALDLARGEVGGARIESSTLGHPTIETCLREAAFALEVPRAYRNDEPVTAILNLVFRPHTPDRAPTTQDPGISREIDLLVEGALKAPEAAADVAGAAPGAVPGSPDAGVGPR
ncbi:MAG TPA: VWA domain-containing protein [Polyangia bacterium]